MDSLKYSQLTIRKKRIFVVDTDVMNHQRMEELLDGLGYESVIVARGAQALETLDSSFDLALLDMMMPGMDGLSLLRKIRQRADISDIPVIMAVSLTGRKHRIEALEAGADDFVAKPVDTMELRVRMTSLFKIKAAQEGSKEYQARLENMVRVRTKALIYTVENLTHAQRVANEAHRETIRCLAIAAEHRNVDVADHIMRMSEYSALIARNIGLSNKEVGLIQETSPMHDIGKIGIADAILLKPGKLSLGEWDVMKEHARIGAHILDSVSSSLIQTGSLIAMTHHEKWDGSGYPQGVSGTSIPLYGRICAVADVFDALTTARPYKKAFSIKDALGSMYEVRGKHFDPRILDAFTQNMEEVQRSYLRYHKKSSGWNPLCN